MKTVSNGFMTMLQGNQSLMVADLYTITLASGTVLYYTDAPQSITIGGNTYQAAQMDSAPGFARGPIKLAIGLQVDSIEVDLFYDANTRILGLTPGAFANGGGFDDAKIKIDKFLTTSFATTTNGIVNLFTGVVSDVQAGSGKVNLSVASNLVYLNGQFPRNYFLPQCNHALFDAGCGLNKASFAISGTVTSTGGAPTQSVFSSNCTQADGWFALGYVVWLTGANAGIEGTVKTYTNASGKMTLMYPLPVAPSVGDTFTAYPGCDKTQATCSTKFNNLSHFRGFPFVPTPEVIELGSSGSAPQDNAGGGAGMGPGGISRGGGGQRGRFELQ